MEAWILAMMLRLEPSSPFRDSFESSAKVIADVSTSSPLFAGDDGPSKTAALLVSLGWFEGRFNPRAEGDRIRRKDNTLGPPTSHCMFQISESNTAALGVTPSSLKDSFSLCTRSAVRMMRMSMSICSARPLEERLTWYAAGGPSCSRSADPVTKSRHRVLKGLWIHAHRNE